LTVSPRRNLKAKKRDNTIRLRRRAPSPSHPRRDWPLIGHRPNAIVDGETERLAAFAFFDH
jgi:hypothetical protein